MADRTLDDVAILSAECPGGSSDTIELTLTDPSGTVVVDAVTVPHLAQNKFVYTTPDPLTMAGVYRADWVYVVGGQRITQHFTVGRQPLVGITKYELRLQIAQRVGEALIGEIYSADTQSFTDLTLIGQPEEYLYWWAVLEPSTDDAGRSKRIIGYNGSALEVAPPFITAPSMGNSYTLMRIAPSEIDRVMRIAFNELSNQTRIDIHLNDVVFDTDNITTFPDGISHVVEVFDGTTKLKIDGWSLLTGRRLQLTSTASEGVDILAIRQAGYPVWDDSIVEADPTSIVARAANLLHANRAAGSAIDVEEHLRRQLAAADDFERARRIAIGRIPPGTRPVLE